MVNKIPPLTVTYVQQAKPKLKEYNLSDGNGLAFRVKPIVSKFWIFNYQWPISKNWANFTLGYLWLKQEPKQLKPESYLLSEGIDPKEHIEEAATSRLSMDGKRVLNPLGEFL